MFHKEGSTSDSGNKSAESTLRKSDLRRLKSDFVRQFRIPTEDETHGKIVEEMFARIHIRKLRQLNVSIYFRDCEKDGKGCEDIDDEWSWPYRETSQPILIDLDLKQSSQNKERNSWMPALPLLHFWIQHASTSCKDLIPNVIVHAPVSKFICRGADLMKSGIAALKFRDYDVSTGNHFKPGKHVCISVNGNPMPFAVGEVMCEDLKADFGPGTKGVGVRIVSAYGDDLWRKSFHLTTNIGKQVSDITDDLRHFGNEGFIDGEVVLPYLISERENDGVSSDDESVSNNDHSTDVPSNVHDTEMSPERENENKTSNLSNDDDDREDNKRLPTNEISDSESSEASDSKDYDDSKDNVVDHDELLLHAFMYSLNDSVKDKALPITIASFYAGHIIPAVKKQGNQLLDIKKTRYKKISAFLQHQASEGVISLAPSKDKRDPIAFLSGVNRSHPKLREVKKAMKALSISESSTSKSSADRKIVLVNLFLVPTKVVTAMNLDKDLVSAKNAKSQERRGTGFLTAAESREILDLYIVENNLVDQNSPKYITVDGPLGDVLWGLTKRERQVASKSPVPSRPDHINRKQLQERWQSKLELGYAIVSMPGSKILSLKRGSPPKISIEVEKRQGNKKFITRVRGLEEVSNAGCYMFFCSLIDLLIIVIFIVKVWLE